MRAEERQRQRFSQLLCASGPPIRALFALMSMRS